MYEKWKHKAYFWRSSQAGLWWIPILLFDIYLKLGEKKPCQKDRSEILPTATQAQLAQHNSVSCSYSAMHVPIVLSMHQKRFIPSVIDPVRNLWRAQEGCELLQYYHSFRQKFQLLLMLVGCLKVGQFCQLKLCWIHRHKMWMRFFANKAFATFYKMWSCCQFEMNLVSDYFGPGDCGFVLD